MRVVRRMGGVCLQRMVALAAVLMMSAAGQAQVMSQVPANALVVMHVKNLQDFSKKVATLATNLGATDANAPAATDMEGFFIKQINASKGVNLAGDFAVAYLGKTPAPADAAPGNTPPILVLVPVTDYQALLSNYPDAKTDGGVSAVTMPDGQPSYIANWGNYAAYGSTKEVLALTPGGFKIPDAAARELDAKDACIIVNMPAVRTKILPFMLMARTHIRLEAAAALGPTPMAKYTDAIRTGVEQVLNLAQKVIDTCNVVTFGVNLSDTGISSTAVIDMKPDSELGQLIAAEKDTDSSLLTGLPDGGYLCFGGAVSDPKGSAKLIAELVDPIIPQLDKVGDDAKPFMQFIQAIKDIAGAQTGVTFGMVAPQGELGTSPLIQFVGTRTGDVKTISTATQTMMDVQA